MTAPLLHRGTCVPLLLLYKLVVIVDANHTSGGFMLDTSHPWWIISTSTSRHPNRGLYLDNSIQTTQGVGRYRRQIRGGALKVKDFDYDSPDLQMAIWIWPVPGSVDQFWLVGGKDSERPGYTVYLDSDSRTVWQVFRPEDPDDRFIWKLIPKTSYGDRNSADMDDTTEPHGTSTTPLLHCLRTGVAMLYVGQARQDAVRHRHSWGQHVAGGHERRQGHLEAAACPMQVGPQGVGADAKLRLA